jgi:hypothetical protein
MGGIFSRKSCFWYHFDWTRLHAFLTFLTGVVFLTFFFASLSGEVKIKKSYLNIRND